MSAQQAVLLIHGVGEQRPMATLRAFVDAVWTRDATLHNRFAPSTLWSKPDFVSESFELRRLTTARSRAELRTDFYEFYWAHLLDGTRLAHLLAWARTLLWRSPRRVPAALRGAWVLLWIGALAAAGLFLHAASGGGAPHWLPPAAAALGGTLLLPLLAWILQHIVGDAARYLHVAPANIQCRHAIRSAGVAVLDELHRRGYERIVVVGHSLGSVIGYDILNFAFARRGAQFATQDAQGHACLDELERASAGLRHGAGATDAAAYQALQARYHAELRGDGFDWRVTDFVTLGSPLAHAAVLLAPDAEALARQQSDRELPTCPPAMETIPRRSRFSRERFTYACKLPGPPPRRRFWVPHHAAVFAATRWTNLYFPARAMLWGDFIGGPLRGLFGAGIRDVALPRGGLFAHGRYWRSGAAADDAGDAGLCALREALDLANDRGA